MTGNISRGGSKKERRRRKASLRSADAFPVVASLPPEGEATTGNASALRRLEESQKDAA